MSLADRLQIPTPDAEGRYASTAPGAGSPAADAGVSAAAVQAELLQQARARSEQLGDRLAQLDELLSKPLNEILAERDAAKASAEAWDAFGAMWMLSQRAMKRVALDLAAAHGVSADEVVQRAMAHANAVLNAEENDLGGLLAPAQLTHVGRHKPVLRRQFRTG